MMITINDKYISKCKSKTNITHNQRRISNEESQRSFRKKNTGREQRRRKMITCVILIEFPGHEASTKDFSFSEIFNTCVSVT